ncbi:hypothetical protein B0T22DRAFT_506479 [Podospora appendiculata]|uniref:BTB domain transcription factor n=1 Tax=Podospora appendiculata TaxID=314037 RepID=A0AAE0XIR6_9PEZI|nr:hypothetical protein B0T22DRAFT_506479 [Podospora appendiculata]
MTSATRSSAKHHEGPPAPPASEAPTRSKHKRDDGVASPDAKRSRKSDEKDQQTIEESFATSSTHQDTKDGEETEDEQTTDTTLQPQDEKGTAPQTKHQNNSAVEPGGRDGSETMPSSILEKGIIYFFFRGRVGIDEPSEADDIARSYILLRPIEKDAKLGSGPIGDAGNTRLCAIPKKVLPLSGRDRWISFVEKAGASFQQIKDEFLSATDYATRTAGTRHSPAATPVGEGVYAITSTGRESHLAYMLTLPDKLGEVQKEIGLREKGSFILSTKNPEYPGPASTQLPKGPEYPKEVLKEFRSLRWMPTLPKHLDYVNTQFLLIGESSGVEKALETQKKDQKAGVEEPAEELEKLEEEDAVRMKHLNKDDASRIFADLEVHAKEFPKLQTTF